MAQLSPNSIQLLNGKITLTKRSHSSAWQMRYKIGDRWLRETTKEKDLKEAQQVAEEIYLRAKFRQSENLPIVSKRFDAVARMARNKMQTQLDNEEGKKVYKDYIRVIDNYLIDFFGLQSYFQGQLSLSVALVMIHCVSFVLVEAQTTCGLFR